MKRFGETCAAIAAKPAKLEKIAILARYLQALGDADLQAAARFFTGNPFAARDERSLGIGWRTIVEAARKVWDVHEGALAASYRQHGDLGAALGPQVRPPMDLALFSETLTPAALYAIFEEIAAAKGKAAGKKREALCERILRACTQPVEATYVIKILTGDLRIGLREGLILDAIAQAFGADARAVRRATMAAGDVGLVAVAARHRRLDEMRVAYGSPIGFMLATPVTFGSDYHDLREASWIAEEKFDGIRAQVHKYGQTVRIFSRTLNEVTHSYPEVAAAATRLAHDVMLDGELVAQRGNRVLPFRYLQARLQRKAPGDALASEVPVVYMAFDILAAGDEFLIDEPLLERRAYLADRVVPSEHLRVAAFTRLADPPPAEKLHALFEKARESGHEGIVLKRTDAPYHPGRRGKWWLKLKRELDTLDVVVVAVEWGHGKRAKVLSDYTFAVRGENGELLTIGKAYSGLTDAEIATLTPWFLEHRLPESGRRERARHGEIPVEPKIVLEVAFDIIQPSDLHESGFSLRFPRIIRIRDDKPASEIDTIERVREIHEAMLAREGFGPP
jgi:DNA ligase-1